MRVLLGVADVADPGVRVVPRCEVAAISFSTPMNAWLVDRCGKVFRSSHGGHGWVSAPPAELAFFGVAGGDGWRPSQLARLTWLNATTAPAFELMGPPEPAKRWLIGCGKA